MRITLGAFGTRGDIQPQVVLGKALQEVGHEVTMVTHETIRPWVESFGIPMVGFPDPFRMLPASVGRAWQVGTPAAQDAVFSATVDAFTETAVEPLAQVFARSDALITGMLLLPAAMVLSRALRRPLVTLHVAPLMGTNRPDSNYTVMGSPNGQGALGALRASLATWERLQPMARRAAALVGARPPQALVQVGQLLRLPHITAVSRVIAPALGPTHHRTPTTGFLLLDSQEALEPSLAAFLEAGPPPIHLSLGALTDGSEDSLGVLVEALTGSGRRVITPRQDGFDGRFDPALVQLIDHVPHDVLFPRCAAIVHHGGAGTTGAAIAAGVPQWALPMVKDQPYFGRRLHELGVAAAPVALRDVRPRELVDAVAFADRPSTQARARALQTLVRAENGTRQTLAAVQRILGQPVGH